MIYISSSCVKNSTIKQSIEELVSNNILNIELSGGTQYYTDIEYDLLSLQTKYDLNIICHNYFPPPKENFVLNLASLNDEIYEKSIQHLIKSINLSKKIGASKFGFHAGFFMDISTNEIGKKISNKKLFDKNECLQQFIKAFTILKEEAGTLNLYIENNVYSKTNFNTFQNNNPFMLCSHQDYLNLKKEIDFNLLLDVAHLKVSSKTLNLNFKEELEKLIICSDYIHISENDSLHDLNLGFNNSSEIICELNKYDLQNKDFTLETYTKINDIMNNYSVLRKMINND